MRTIPYAAGTAAAVIGATLLLSGSASAAPAGDDRVPPDGAFTVCSAEGTGPSPRIKELHDVEPRWDRRPATPGEPEVHCAAADGAPGTCAVVVPARPAEQGGDVLVPARPGEPRVGAERAHGPGDTIELTCEGAGIVQAVPRR
jgi:hypothetical protein